MSFDLTLLNGNTGDDDIGWDFCNDSFVGFLDVLYNVDLEELTTLEILFSAYFLHKLKHLRCKLAPFRVQPDLDKSIFVNTKE